MRKHNYLRSLLGLGAVLAVAGPGLVLADCDPSYVPRILQMIGPSSVPVSTSTSYIARVTFTNGVVCDFTDAPVLFSASRGSFSGNVYTAPASTGRDSVKGVFTQQSVTVTGTKIILNP